MKTRIITLFSMLFTILLMIGGVLNAAQDGAGPQSVHVYCTPVMSNVATAWAEGFSSQYPTVIVEKNVQESIPKELQGENALALTFDSYSGEDTWNWKMTVGRDILVPVVNQENPYLGELRKTGVTQEKLRDLFSGESPRSWREVLDEGNGVPLKVYIPLQNGAQARINAFLGLSGAYSPSIIPTDEKKALLAIQSDPYAIGFFSLAYITTPDGHGLADGLSFLPIDRNGNGRLDLQENIYDDPETFARGVWIGKYPHALTRDIYLVASETPTNDAGVAFLSWVVTIGQQYMHGCGFSDLVFSERQTKLDKINNTSTAFTVPVKPYPVPQLVLWISIVVVLIALIITTILRHGRGHETFESTVELNSKDSFDENSVAAPKGLYFDRTHTWAFMEKDGLVRVGLDDFLQHVTGSITRVDLKKPGEHVNKGELLVTLSQVGKHLKIYSPVSGTVVQVNKSLHNNPSLINKSPYSEGWVCLVEPLNWAGEIRQLSMAEKYLKSLKDEMARLKDFLAAALSKDQLQYAGVVIQDGGALKDHILEDFGPETWEDFQTGFMDSGKQ